jgi:hypothetical protein
MNVRRDTLAHEKNRKKAKKIVLIMLLWIRIVTVGDK